jgi:hypothetical protein
MRGFLYGLEISLAFIFGALSTGRLLPQAAAGSEPAAGKASHSSAKIATPEPEAPALVMPIPRWEYICYRAELTHKLVEVANEAGEEGWEMVGTDGQGAEPSVWCFKRRKNAPLAR